METIRRILCTVVVLTGAVSVCQADEGLEAKLAKLVAASKTRQPANKPTDKAPRAAALSVETLGDKIKTLAERLDELTAGHKGMEQAYKGFDSRLGELERKFETSKTRSLSQAQKAHDDLYAKLDELEGKIQGLQARSKASAAKQTSTGGAAKAQGIAPVLQSSAGKSSGQEISVAQVAGSSSEGGAVRAKPQEPATKPAAPKIMNVSAAKSSAQAQSPAKNAAKPGPKYSNLRCDEDFSYLADPDTPYTKDMWDPIKWMDVGDGWRLTLGGQARARFESETNKNFGSTEPTQDAFLLQRYFLHADLRHAEGLRFFIQGKAAHANFRDRGGFGGLEDHADFQQGFIDFPTPFTGRPVTFRLGRQELQYGAQRLISPLDWGNLRRTFEGAKVFANLSDWRLDAFAVRPVLNDGRNLNEGDENVDFYGFYSTYKGSGAVKADFYSLLLKNDNPAPNSNAVTGRRTLYTVGTRLWGKGQGWDWETELASQFGTFAGDRVRAWMATAGTGYTFADTAWKPRLGVLYDYASGDKDPTDGTHGTFNQLFPLGHAHLGYLDRVGRSNIHGIKAQLKVKPSKKITAWADFHTFYVAEDKDSLYSAGGGSLRRDTAGVGSRTVGHELDLTAKIVIDAHTNALMGWAHIWPGGFIEKTGDDDSPDLFYAQVEYKF